MERILVVEDDPALREELVLLLQANGYWAVEKTAMQSCSPGH